MSELEIALSYDPGSGTWDAYASKDDSVEYDTGGAGARIMTPEAALFVLAKELYRMLDEVAP